CTSSPSPSTWSGSPATTPGRGTWP
ncbi:MAG: hypothetical protein AVDCRST_MAG79-1930, partial [uncultured Thermoleophilia bacterium]